MKSLIWYPNHDVSSMTLKDQDVAESLEWLAATPRMYMEIYNNQPLTFPNLQASDLDISVYFICPYRQLMQMYACKVRSLDITDYVS